jgi:hypothetical protein
VQVSFQPFTPPLHWPTVGPVRMARDPISRLRTAIDCLPEHTRRAMLEGIRDHPIVVGAYTDGDGGVCPMLAAHRHGGRTSFLSFARAWDGFARADGVRPATARELRVLEDLLEASLAGEDRGLDLGAAIAEHRAALARRREQREITARRLRPSRVRFLRARSVSPSPPAGPPDAAGGAARRAW